MSITRHQMRETAFILTFEKIFKDDSIESVESILENAKEIGEIKLSDDSIAIFKGISDNIEQIDEKIKTCLQGWSIARISKVALALLRVAVYEISYANTPVGVAIDEAVELAKQYSTQEDAKYINGVLGSFAKTLGQ